MRNIGFGILLGWWGTAAYFVGTGEANRWTVVAALVLVPIGVFFVAVGRKQV